jgi:hypothetical protein
MMPRLSEGLPNALFAENEPVMATIRRHVTIAYIFILTGFTGCLFSKSFIIVGLLYLLQCSTIFIKTIFDAWCGYIPVLPPLTNVFSAKQFIPHFQYE